MSDSAPSIRLCPEHLCELFWRQEMMAKVESGEWRQEIRPKGNPEAGTFRPFRDYSGNWIVKTQELSWIDNATNQERARLHRYITETGTIGGSGYPDPKRLKLDNGQKYRLTRPSEQEPCAKCGRVGHEWPRKREHRDRK